jgi:HAD superfamily hydrolase (TIGR01549 family)
MIYNIINEIDKFEIISLDIFDTIILRPYLKPADMFVHIEQILNIKNFSKNRIEAEKKARANSVEGEITLNDIYANISNAYKDAFQFELDFEKQICQKNEEMHMAYLHALEKGKKIIFVSDMYLPQSVLEEILINTGFKKYEFLFISSTFKKKKATGELFDVVLEKLNVKPEKILHIGDNKRNDVDMPLSRGINTFYYPKVIDRFLQENSNLKILISEKKSIRFKKDYLSLSIILGLNSIIWIENQKDNYWKKLGSLYAGPFLYFFTKWIYDSAKTNGINNIAFAARDGFNLIKIFHLLDSKKELNSQYVYLPRYVSESANIKSLDDLEFFFNELGKTYDGLLNFIQDFSLENRSIRLKWEKFNVIYKEYSYNDLKSFIISNQLLFIQTSQKKRNIVYEYFESLKLLDSNLMIVDSSCTHARPQKLLNVLISERALGTRLFGYYYQVNKPHDFLNQTEIRPENKKKYRTDRWDLIEFFMSSPESPITAIKKEGNDFYPVYQNVEHNQHERIRIKASTCLTEGVMKFADKAFRIFGHLNIIKNLDTSVYYINNLINNPSNVDVSYIKHLHHSVNNDTVYSPLLIFEGGTGHNLKNIYGQRVQVKRITPEFEHFFLGNFDINATNKKGSNHLALNVPFMNRLPAIDDTASIKIINESCSPIKTLTTNGWDFQHGGYLQYRPEHDHEIVYSHYHKKEKKYTAILYNLKSLEETTFPLPVISISPDGKNALCVKVSGPNEYEAGRRNNTLVNVKFDNIFSSENHEDKGIFLQDLESHTRKIIVTYEKLFQLIGDRLLETNKRFTINRMSFNEDGSRFFILLSFLSNDNSCKDLIITSDLRGEINHKIFGLGLHVNWKDTQNIRISGTVYSQANTKLTPNIYDTQELTDNLLVYDQSFLSIDRQFSYSPDKRYVIQDSDTSNEFPFRKLKIFDLQQKKGIVLGYFYSHPDLYLNNHDLRCDLKARWTSCGKYITFDSIHEGYRGIYRITAAEAINEIEREIDSISEDDIMKILSYAPTKLKQSSFNLWKSQSREKIKNAIKYILPQPIKKMVHKLLPRFQKAYFLNLAPF